MRDPNQFLSIVSPNYQTLFFPFRFASILTSELKFLLFSSTKIQKKKNTVHLPRPDSPTKTLTLTLASKPVTSRPRPQLQPATARRSNPATDFAPPCTIFSSTCRCHCVLDLLTDDLISLKDLTADNTLPHRRLRHCPATTLTTSLPSLARWHF